MPNNIPYNPDSNYEFNSESVQYIQDWNLTPSDEVVKDYVIGQSSPVAQQIDLAIKDFITANPYFLGFFDTFEIDSIIEVESSNPSDTIFLNLEGDLEENQPYVLTLENLNVEMQLAFVNMALLPPGIYKANLSFNAYGVRGQIRQFLESVSLDILVNVIEPNNISFSPSSVSMALALDSGLPIGTATVVNTGVAFVLECPLFITIEGDGILLTESNESVNIYTASGTQELTYNFNDLAYDLGVGFLNAEVLAYNSSGAFVVQTLDIDILETGRLVFLPESYDFFAVKNLVEQEWIYGRVLSASPLSVQSVPWLEVELLEGTDRNIRLRPISSSNFSAGLYSAAISLTNQVETRALIISHRVVEHVYYNLQPRFNWCRDEKAFSQFFASGVNSIGKLSLSIKVGSVNGYVDVPIGLSYEFAFFKYKCSFHIGDVVRRLLKQGSLEEIRSAFDVLLTGVNGEYYYNRPALVNARLGITPEGGDANNLLPGFLNAKYVDGRKPEDAQDTFSILRYSNIPIRVTPKSRLLFNYINIDSPLKLKRYLNYDLVSIQNKYQINQESIGQYIDFENALPGSRHTLGIEKNGVEIKQDYIVFPEGVRSTLISWVDEYKVLRTYEFTGEITVSSEFNNVTFYRYSNLVEYLDKLDVDKEVSIVISSGYILKSNQVIIENLVMMKNAFIVFEGMSEVIEASAISKSMSNEDSERSLYSYDVKFIIKKTNALRSYSSTI